MRYYIYNPLARNNKIINSSDTSLYYDCTKQEDMDSLKEKLNKKDTIIIIGGDGTLNYLINNYDFLKDYELNLFPNGSGNDFYRSLEKDSYFYTLNNNYSFINTFGIGFDAIVCDNVNKSNKKNKLSYLKEAYRGIKNYKPFTLNISYNGNRYEYKKVWLCSLQNGKYFGGGINIAKDANINKEELDLCIAHDLSKVGVLVLLLFVKLGLVHHFKKYFFTVKTKDVTIHNNKVLTAQLDGDVWHIESDIALSAINHLNIKKTPEL